MHLTITSVRLWRTELHTRMPFKYGIATMTHLPHVFIEVVMTIDGVSTTGVSADNLPPRWFTKNPAQSVADEILDMERVVARAADLACGLEAASVFDLWLSLYSRMEAWRQESKLPPLLAHFGTSLIERGMIDAFCRATRVSFAQALRTERFGIRLGTIHPELENIRATDLLCPQPLRSVLVRHTVGLADAVDEDDRTERIGDGLPETLEENIAAYGLRHFKIKFTGPAELPRLSRIFDTLATADPATVRFTLDGNESFPNVAAFRTVWEELKSLPQWSALSGGLLCVEQPFNRAIALSEEVQDGLLQWADRPPFIIDESDAEFDSVRCALAAGYVGTSHKNCKGVFRGIANACFIARKNALTPGKPFLQTGEDLANIGPIALLQDLTVQASLGIESVERNGHHYFKGLSFLPNKAQATVLAAHPDLYRRHERGFVAVAVEAGRGNIGSLIDGPFGVAFHLDFDSFAGPLNPPALDANGDASDRSGSLSWS